MTVERSPSSLPESVACKRSKLLNMHQSPAAHHVEVHGSFAWQLCMVALLLGRTHAYAEGFRV